MKILVRPTPYIPNHWNIYRTDNKTFIEGLGVYSIQELKDLKTEIDEILKESEDKKQ